MRVVAVPCLKDNFAYLVIDGDHAAVVDPGEAPPVEAALAHEKVKLAAIWLTHHHPDHVGGVAALVAKHKTVEVVAGITDAKKIAHVTRTVREGDTVTMGHITATIIDNPGHTLGAVSFHIEAPVSGAGAVFTGDTLFAAGCGRVFEGDAPMMHASLMKLASLPPATKVYFGHEYTANNLKFAAVVEPDNQAVAIRLGNLTLPSTPSTIEVELATNPFLRAAEPAVAAAAKNHGAGHAQSDIFHALREWKNRF